MDYVNKMPEILKTAHEYLPQKSKIKAHAGRRTA